MAAYSFILQILRYICLSQCENIRNPPAINLRKKIAGSNFSCTFMHSTLKSENKLQKKCTYNSRVVYPTRVCQEIKLTSLKQLKKNRFFFFWILSMHCEVFLTTPPAMIWNYRVKNIIFPMPVRNFFCLEIFDNKTKKTNRQINASNHGFIANNHIKTK